MGATASQTAFPSLLSPSRFRFLNKAHELLSAADWHAALIGRWVAENPPVRGNGWEAYPLSLQIVNWIEWAWAGNDLPPGGVESLALQARYLRKRLEWHILRNHLLANAKALIFAGLFFEGPEAEGWLATEASIFSRQLAEQGRQLPIFRTRHYAKIQDFPPWYPILIFWLTM